MPGVALTLTPVLRTGVTLGVARAGSTAGTLTASKGITVSLGIAST